MTDFKNVETKQKISKTFQQQTKPLKQLEVIAPWNPEVVEFETPTEFEAFWRNHEDEFEGLSTYKLNMKYKVPGYKLTWKTSDNNKYVALKKDYTKSREAFHEAPCDEHREAFHEMLHETLQRVDALEKDLRFALKRIENIENYLKA